MKKVVVSSLLMFALLASVSVMAQGVKKDVPTKPKSEVKTQLKEEMKKEASVTADKKDVKKVVDSLAKKDAKKVDATAKKVVPSTNKTKK